MRVRSTLALVALAAAGAISAAGAAVGEDWAPLRRPLRLPEVAAGAPCPVSPVDRRVPWKRINIFGGTGIGRGPVYPGLGGHSGLVFAIRDEQYGSPWFGAKVFWYVQPSYRGPVLIRGRRLDGPEWVRFNGRRHPPAELHIDRGETVSWSGQPPGSRGVPSSVRLLEPGCYAFQIDGTSFSRTVVFVADLGR